MSGPYRGGMPQRPNPQSYMQTRPGAGYQNDALYQQYLARNPAARGPSGYINQQDPNAQAQQASQAQRPSPFSQAMDSLTDTGESYAQDAAQDQVSSMFGGASNPALTTTSQAAWNAPGLAASGVGTLGAAGATTAASAAVAPTVAGGTATLPAGAAIGAGWGGVGSAAGGGTMVAPVASSAMGGAGTATSLSTLGTLGAVGALAAYYGPSYMKYGSALTKDPKTDDYVKSAALTNPITAWAVPIADALGVGVKAGKHKDQLMRDQIRDFARERKLTDETNNVTFKDGTKFDMGRDGGYRDEKGLRNFELDHNSKEQPYTGKIISDLAPLGLLIGGTNRKAIDDTTGMFTKAALSGAKNEEQAMQKAREIYSKMGVTKEVAFAKIAELEKLPPDKGGIDKQTADIHRNGVNRMLGGSSPSQPQRQIVDTPTSKLGWQPMGAATVSQQGQWVDKDGKPVTGVDPGRLNTNRFIPASTQPVTAQAPTAPARSRTLSEGIGLDGKPINYNIPRKR